MSHEGHTSSLRGAAEERNLNFPGFQVCGIFCHAAPSFRTNGLFIIFSGRYSRVESGINLDVSPKADF